MPGACEAFAIHFSTLARLSSACRRGAVGQQLRAHAGCCGNFLALCSSGGFFGHPDPSEDEDAYAARIWRVSQLSEWWPKPNSSCSAFGPACRICRTLLLLLLHIRCCCCTYRLQLVLAAVPCRALPTAQQRMGVHALSPPLFNQTLAACLCTAQATRSPRLSSVVVLHSGAAMPVSEMTGTWVQEMERKRHLGTDGAAAGREHFRLQREAQQAKEQAAFEAAQNSRRILGDERAKDHAWRDAVLKAGICTCLIRRPPALLE